MGAPEVPARQGSIGLLQGHLVVDRRGDVARAVLELRVYGLDAVEGPQVPDPAGSVGFPVAPVDVVARQAALSDS